MASTSNSPLSSYRPSASSVATAISAASASPQASLSSRSPGSWRGAIAGWGDSVTGANALFRAGSLPPRGVCLGWLALGTAAEPVHATKAPHHQAATAHARYRCVTAIGSAAAGRVERAKAPHGVAARGRHSEIKSSASAALFLLSGSGYGQVPPWAGSPQQRRSALSPSSRFWPAS